MKPETFRPQVAYVARRARAFRRREADPAAAYAAGLLDALVVGMSLDGIPQEARGKIVRALTAAAFAADPEARARAAP